MAKSANNKSASNTVASNTGINKSLLLFGGSFDPVHTAHLEAALAASRALHDAPVTFLPNARSPLKNAADASDVQRLAMLELALADQPLFHLSRFEIERPAPSFMQTSLEHFRAQQGTAPLVLIMGADSLANLQHWKNWQAFPALCHLLVLPRPQTEMAAADVLAAFPEASAADLLSQPAGKRLMLAAPCLDISATHIRTQLAQGETPTGLPASVADYIRTHRLYHHAPV